MGVIISLMGILENKIKPQKLIVMGVPIEYASLKEIDLKYLFMKSSNKFQILVIQQKNDPQGKSTDVKNILPRNVEFVEIKGTHHVYGNIKSIKCIIDLYLNKK